MGYADKIQDLIQISEDEQKRIKEKVRKATEGRKSPIRLSIRSRTGDGA